VLWIYIPAGGLQKSVRVVAAAAAAQQLQQHADMECMWNVYIIGLQKSVTSRIKHCVHYILTVASGTHSSQGSYMIGEQHPLADFGMFFEATFGFCDLILPQRPEAVTNPALPGQSRA
jgi:hypothetical protein